MTRCTCQSWQENAASQRKSMDLFAKAFGEELAEWRFCPWCGRTLVEEKSIDDEIRTNAEKVRAAWGRIDESMLGKANTVKVDFGLPRHHVIDPVLPMASDGCLHWWEGPYPNADDSGFDVVCTKCGMREPMQM